MTQQDPHTTAAAVEVVEPPDRTILYWPETDRTWPIVLVRDDQVAEDNDYRPDHQWFRPGDDQPPATWADTVAWIRSNRGGTATDPLAEATVAQLPPDPDFKAFEHTLDDDSLSRLALHTGMLMHPLLQGDQSTPYELTAEDAASTLAVLAMVPQLVTALRDTRASLRSKDAEITLLGHAVDRLTDAKDVDDD